MRTSFKAAVSALTITATCGAWTPGHACDVNSPTDISCGPANINPANPLSPLNPINQQQANSFANQQQTNSFNNFYSPTNPYSPYFSTPVYAYGILGLLEGDHPTIIYPAGPPRTCRLGVDCPQRVDGSQSTQAAYPAPEEAAESRPAGHERHHRRHSQAR